MNIVNPVDRDKVRLEYVTKGTSCRELAKKYGLQPTTVQRWSKADGWPAQRDEYVRNLAAKCVQKTQSHTVDAATRISASAVKLLDKCDSLLAIDDVVAPRDLKAIADTLASCKTLLGVRDDDGQQKQDAVQVIGIPEEYKR